MFLNQIQRIFLVKAFYRDQMCIIMSGYVISHLQIKLLFCTDLFKLHLT